MEPDNARKPALQGCTLIRQYTTQNYVPSGELIMCSKQEEKEESMIHKMKEAKYEMGFSGVRGVWGDRGPLPDRQWESRAII